MRWILGLIVTAAILGPANGAKAQFIFSRHAYRNQLWSARAAVYYQQAERLAIENRVLRARAYFELRRINRENRAAERSPAPSIDDLARYAQAAAPRRLRSDEFNPETGQITWPRVLRTNTYIDDREQLDDCFASKAKSDDGLDEETYQRTLGLNRDMMEKLKDHIQQIFPNDYLAARSFLRSLAMEARYGKQSSTP